MSFDFTTLVTDRTAADVKWWETLRNKGFINMTDAERSEWLAGNMKGAYNKDDLNRVGEALNYLRDRLTEANYITYQTNFTAKTNWTITSIPTADDLTYYLKCVSNIREAMAQFETTPHAPTDTGALDYEEANNIEKILIDVETLINNMLAARLYCGDVFAGEI
jgi:hypothetical protein